MASERWDWWNEYTAKDEMLDCLIALYKKLGRWPEHKEVTEVWPQYPLAEIQAKFGAYNLAIEAARGRLCAIAQGYRVRRPPQKTQQEIINHIQPTIRQGRGPKYSDEQLLEFVRKIIEANGGELPTTGTAMYHLRRMADAPSIATLTKRIGPIAEWKKKLNQESH